MGWLTRDAHFCNVNSKIERHSAHLGRWGWGGGEGDRPSRPPRPGKTLICGGTETTADPHAFAVARREPATEIH